jgi:hypothetical protein
MRLVTRSIGTALLLCAAAFAQDSNFVGKWAGAADTTDEAGTKRQERQTFDIKIEDGKLVAQQLNRNGGGTPLDIQTDGTRVNLYRYLDFEGGEPLRWKLELKNGVLTGTFSAQHHAPKKWIYDRVGIITLRRDDAPAAPAPAAK